VAKLLESLRAGTALDQVFVEATALRLAELVVEQGGELLVR
jgi:hypothetical protein